ncbi:PHP domain-containing protein [Shewanella sp. 202IG2-18]|uniref:RNase RNM n=1 Tax=Parashewanella hymeniacidonis TaxID=2807618 RepID=UPI00196212B8|nr:PHP domain-containing protein [Parashewanella hymeniacidonis]MBM7070552.1 PHP domain-containing protein [Parashewanella hymeniacidonis]
MNEESTLIDLHCHTTASDGQLTPSEIIDRALTRNVDVLAITDHDTVQGLFEAHEYNNKKDTPLTLINGVEISCRWESHDIHVVGLNVDIENPQLDEYLKTQRVLREERAAEIGRRLEKAGVIGAYEGAKSFANGAALSRGHYASWLVKNDYAKCRNSVFKKYMTRGKTGYVPNNWKSIPEAVAIIHQAGGQAVLAHPSGYKFSSKWLKKLVREFKEANGDAIEVVLGQQSINERSNLIALSHQNELYASLGSDFHFPGGWLELGKNLFRPKGVNWVWESQNWKKEIKAEPLQ